jgi:aspartyl-tRNA(Asn)/glutamyl-tRNA(Gln) amidotransferase subunit A
VAPAEASSNLARYDGVRYGLRAPADDIIGMYEATRAKGFGPRGEAAGADRHLCASAGYYDAYYLRAQKVRTLIKRDFEQAFAPASTRSSPRRRRPRRSASARRAAAIRSRCI